MSDQILRTKLIRLAHANPSLREALLPLLRSSAEIPGDYLALDAYASELERLIARFPNMASEDMHEAAKQARLKAREAYKNRSKKADQDDPTHWYGLEPREPAIDKPALQPKEAKRRR